MLSLEAVPFKGGRPASWSPARRPTWTWKAWANPSGTCRWRVCMPS